MASNESGDLQTASVDGNGRKPISELAARSVHGRRRDAIQRALETARFNKSLAAKALGLTRKQLYIRLRQHGIEWIRAVTFRLRRVARPVSTLERRRRISRAGE
jgi:DNA-binding NtrC family response regulator